MNELSAQDMECQRLLRFNVILALVILAFLSPAIVSNGYYAPGDNIRRFSAFLSDKQSHNYLLMDPVVQMMPWLQYARETVRHGHLPLWNTYSGGGAPLLANPQATVLFPLTWIHFIFGFKTAFLLVAFLKLFLVGFWTYLYLREIRMAPFVAGAGALVFTFCGFNITWLAWPLPAVTMALPCGLYFLERYFVQFQEEPGSGGPGKPKNKRHPLLPLICLSPAVAWGILAGHPQTFFHIAFALVLYALYKALTVQKLTGRKFGFALKHLALVAGAFALGGALTSMMCVPFAEYLLSSFKFISRSEWINASYLPPNMANPPFHTGLLRQPDSGSERERFAISNYNESTMSYVGLTMLFLAGVGLFAQWKSANRGPSRFFAWLALFCVAVIYHFPIVFDLVTHLPVFHQVHNQRLALELGFCLVVLVATGCRKS